MFKTVLTLFRGSVASAGEELESRTALLLILGDGERNDLAQDAAQAIATLEADRDAATTARALFATEIARLKRQVANAETRITELDRGRRIARAAEAVRTLRKGGVEAARPYESTLPEAEATLKRLRERQIEAAAADEALIELDAASGPLATAERLAEQGFGPRLRPTADDVLARLKAKRAQDK